MSYEHKFHLHGSEPSRGREAFPRPSQQYLYLLYCSERTFMTSQTALALQHSLHHDQALPPSFSSIGRLASILSNRRSAQVARGDCDEVTFNYLDKTEKHMFSFTVNKKSSYVRLDCLVLALANFPSQSETSLLPYPWKWHWKFASALSSIDQLGLSMTKESHEVWVPMDDARSTRCTPFVSSAVLQ
jgi:hypothetical protein